MTANATADWTAPGPEEVAPGVHRIPLPLPMDGLKAVNVYAVIGEDRHTLIDGGWEIEVAQRALDDALGELGLTTHDFEQCLVTHHHRDHFTMAMGLRQRAGLIVGLGEGEAPQLEAIRSTHGLEGSHTLLVAAGATSVIEAIAKAPHEHQDRDLWADPDRWLADDESVAAAGRSLRVKATPGHTSGHVVFFDDEADLVFAGDHVLPHITPSIGLEAARTPLPLGDYLSSLRLVGELPDLRLLPAHGPVTGSAHARVAELLDHHERRLDQTAAAVLAGAATGFEVAGVLGWTRRERAFADLDEFNRILAVGETLAHLDVLVERGRLRRSTSDGVDRYRQA